MSDKLTADKLASIKTKIRTRRRNQIADTDILSGKGLAICHFLTYPGEIQRLNDPAGNNFERVWRNRTTVLQCKFIESK